MKNKEEKKSLKPLLLENLIEILTILGVISISTGMFIISVPVGFIGTGGIFVALAIILYREGV